MAVANPYFFKIFQKMEYLLNILLTANLKDGIFILAVNRHL